jgi:hypothetical protein
MELGNEGKEKKMIMNMIKKKIVPMAPCRLAAKLDKHGDNLGEDGLSPLGLA